MINSIKTIIIHTCIETLYNLTPPNYCIEAIQVIISNIDPISNFNFIHRAARIQCTVLSNQQIQIYIKVRYFVHD